MGTEAPYNQVETSDTSVVAGARLHMPNTGPGYDFPVKLSSLPVGARFADYSDWSGVWGLHDTLRFGTLLWVGAGGVEIWLDGRQHPQRCQPDLPVYKLDEDVFSPADVHRILALHTAHLGGPLMAELISQSSPQVKTLLARYTFQLNTLIDALDGDDKAKASICMHRLEKVIAECRSLHVVLPETPARLATYEPLLQVLTDDAEARQHAAAEREIQQATQRASAQKHTDRAVAVERHQTESKLAAAREPRAPKPKVEKKLRPCLDGCGKLVAGNFDMGHDAKLKSLLIKIERGDKPLTDLPDIVLDLVKIVKGETVQERDSQGQPKGEPKQTYRIAAAPVRFPGRDDIALTKRED